MVNNSVEYANNVMGHSLVEDDKYSKDDEFLAAQNAAIASEAPGTDPVSDQVKALLKCLAAR